MKVLMMTDAFSPCPYSASQRLSSFAEVLSSKGFEIAVITASRCRKAKSLFSSDEIFSVYDIRCPRFLLSVSSVIVNPFLFLLYLVAGIVVVSKNDVDVILSSVPNGEVCVAGFFLSKMFGIPFILDMRDKYPPPPVEFPFLNVHVPSKMNDFLTRFFEVIYKNSAKIICVDMDIKRHLVKCGVSVEKTLIITNGADVSQYKPSSSKRRQRIRVKYELSLDKFIFVYAGALAPYYPVGEAVKGLRKISCKVRNNIQLLIISHTNYASYGKLAKKLGLKESVKLTGPLPITDTSEIISACDAGIVTYPGEDYWKSMYGGKIFSYMSCGIPILASGPFGSVIDNLIKKHNTGFFVGKPSENSFAEGFLLFLNHRNEAKVMGENARKTVENFYDRRKLGLKLVSVIERVCRGYNR